MTNPVSRCTEHMDQLRAARGSEDIADRLLRPFVLRRFLALIRHPLRQGIGEDLWFLEERLVAALLE